MKHCHLSRYILAERYRQMQLITTSGNVRKIFSTRCLGMTIFENHKARKYYLSNTKGVAPSIQIIG